MYLPQILSSTSSATPPSSLPCPSLHQFHLHCLRFLRWIETNFIIKVPHSLSSFWLVGIILFGDIGKFYENPSFGHFGVKSVDLRDARVVFVLVHV